MRAWLLILAMVGTPACATLPAPGTPGAPADSRYCGEPERYANGEIKRSAAVVRRFKAVWPMPQDGRVWYVDHVIPRAQGGCDLMHNLQWLPAEIKVRRACSALLTKDCFEQDVYRTEDVSP